MRSSKLTIVLILLAAALAARWTPTPEPSALAQPPLPALIPPKEGVGVLTLELQGQLPVVSLYNAGLSPLYYETRDYGNPPPESMNVLVMTTEGGYVAPFWGCGTGLETSYSKLEPGTSMTRSYAGHRLIRHQGPVKLVAQLKVRTYGDAVTLTSNELTWDPHFEPTCRH